MREWGRKGALFRTKGERERNDQERGRNRDELIKPEHIENSSVSHVLYIYTNGQALTFRTADCHIHLCAGTWIAAHLVAFMSRYTGLDPTHIHVQVHGLKSHTHSCPGTRA